MGDEKCGVNNLSEVSIIQLSNLGKQNSSKFDKDDEIILEAQLESLIDDAFAFYDSEMNSLD